MAFDGASAVVDLVQTPKRLRRDLWVGWKPNGMGEQKPNHYRDIGKVDLGEPAQPAVRVAHPVARASATGARSASRASTTGRSAACTSARRASNC